MPHYLLSVHVGNGSAPAEPPSEEAMRQGMEKIRALEAEMKAQDALVFSGRLTDPHAASVVRQDDGELLTTDGPYLESKEAIGGFYIIRAADEDAARRWASKTTAAVGMPIELRPFVDVASP